jgi:hypothetical protein
MPSSDRATALFNIRQELGILRQPRRATELKAMEGELSAFHLTHPYALPRAAIAHLRTTYSGYDNGGQGRPARLTSGDFLYRLCPVRTIADHTRWKYRFASDDALFEPLIVDFTKEGTWLPLKRYSAGTVSGFRKFTWWTNREINRAAPITEYYRLGIPLNLVPKRALLLRCACTYAATYLAPCVPNVIDAFDGEIFHPTNCASATRAGVTIDLNDSDNLVDGVSEYTLKEIPVEAIEFIPIRVDLTSPKVVAPLDDTLRVALLDYYQRLSEET